MSSRQQCVRICHFWVFHFWWKPDANCWNKSGSYRESLSGSLMQLFRYLPQEYRPNELDHQNWASPWHTLKDFQAWSKWAMLLYPQTVWVASHLMQTWLQLQLSLRHIQDHQVVIGHDDELAQFHSEMHLTYKFHHRPVQLLRWLAICGIIYMVRNETNGIMVQWRHHGLQK